MALTKKPKRPVFVRTATSFVFAGGIALSGCFSNSPDDPDVPQIAPMPPPMVDTGPQFIDSGISPPDDASTGDTGQVAPMPPPQDAGGPPPPMPPPPQDAGGPPPPMPPPQDAGPPPPMPPPQDAGGPPPLSDAAVPPMPPPEPDTGPIPPMPAPSPGE